MFCILVYVGAANNTLATVIFNFDKALAALRALRCTHPERLHERPALSAPTLRYFAAPSAQRIISLVRLFFMKTMLFTVIYAADAPFCHFLLFFTRRGRKLCDKAAVILSYSSKLLLQERQIDR
jgi:hypothetical protein